MQQFRLLRLSESFNQIRRNIYKQVMIEQDAVGTKRSSRSYDGASNTENDLDRSIVEIDKRLFQLKPKKLPPLPRSRDVLHIYGFRHKKNLSQNFLLNSRLINKLVRAAGIDPGHRVVEVGPGPGNLTRAILVKSPFEILVVEKDRRFLPILEQLADSVLPGQMKILLGDALNHTFDNIFGDPKQLLSGYNLPEKLPDYFLNFGREWTDNKLPLVRIIGNLPFNISTALLIKWLHLVSLKSGFWTYGRVPMLLTFQEEVARRICAEPTSFERSRLSAMTQNYCHVDYKFTISGKSFTPPAMVNTGVVRITPRKFPLCEIPFKLFEKFIRHLFHHRNHDLYFNYNKLFPADMRDDVYSCFIKSDVNPKIYPYMISNKEVARLANEYYNYCKRIPSLIDYDYRLSKKLESESSLKVLKEAGLLLLDE